MAARTRFRSLAPRLVLLFAVVFCVLKLGQAGAADQAMPMASMPSTVAADYDHVVQHDATLVHASTVRGLADPADLGRAGHDTGAGRTMSCLAASTLAVFGSPAFADAALLVTPAVSAPLSRMRAGLFALAYPRPPDLTTLCVQRI